MHSKFSNLFQCAHILESLSCDMVASLWACVIWNFKKKFIFIFNLTLILVAKMYLLIVPLLVILIYNNITIPYKPWR